MGIYTTEPKTYRIDNEALMRIISEIEEQRVGLNMIECSAFHKKGCMNLFMGRNAQECKDHIIFLKNMANKLIENM